MPQINIIVSLNTNITSKLLGGGSNGTGGFNEALLIVDDPNAPGPNSNRPILNCGNTGAPDLGPSGPGVCSIVSNGTPSQTYDGSQNTFGATTCTGAGGTPAAGSYGCGRPNVFQGRQGSAQNPGQANIVSFNGVPVDPPGTAAGATRTLRFTNFRADAEFLGVASSFSLQTITMSVSTNGSTSVGINVSSQIVAFVQFGLISPPVSSSRLNFVQCNAEASKLFAGASGAVATMSQVLAGSTAIGANTQSGVNTNGTSGLASYNFKEGFANAWKTKNVSFLTTNGTVIASGGVGYAYNGGVGYPVDVNQNVPGAIYNTESGFEYATGILTPNPNPPVGISTTAVTGANNTNLPFASSTGTGIGTAGVASQGTRLALAFSNVPQGANIYVSPVLYLFRQGATGGSSINYTPFTTSNVFNSTGVAVLTATDAAGDTAYSAVNTTAPFNVVQISNGLAVYEILFSDPSTSEELDVPVLVAYAANLAANPPLGLPVPNQITTAAGGFAPFYGATTSGTTARQPSASLPVPRFIPGQTPVNIFEISKCACNLLFPFVASVGGFDTGIAVANTSADPGATYGFNSTGQQQGTVQFFYYGTGANGAAAPASQTSGVVPAGQILTYVVSTGGGAIGTGPNGLNNTAAGFEGYIIAQTGFQYCHGFAFISALGAGPTSPGVSEGYLAIVLDKSPVLPRTLQAAENDAH
ncbi:MAG TPA: hypothetical protein VKR43_13900 [Bryobacteraceae bacterium]|nr:hypothetical protein [Bryobacteraceae bacterium]